MGFMDKVGSVLFGDAPSTTTVQAADKIGPASEGEQALYGGLQDNAMAGMDYANYLGGQRQGIFDQTMQNMGGYQDQMANMQYDGQLNPQMAGQLRGMYDNQMSNIDSYAEEGVGGLMNQFANRGVLNSSATGRAFGDLGRGTDALKNDAWNQYQNQYMQQYGNQYSNDYNNLTAQSQMNQNNYGFLESAYNNAYSDPYRMWNDERTSRYGLQNDTFVTPGTTGLVQNMGSSLGLIPFMG